MDHIHSPKFSARAEELMKEYHAPGVAIATVLNDVVSSVAFGKASLDPPRACTPDTLFDMASCTKSFTAASVGLLVTDNEKHPDVQWDSIMSNLLPGEFVMPGEGYTETVTVDDILGHRSGMPRHDFSFMGVRSAKPGSPQAITRNLRNLQVAAPIRERHMYCNMMYAVAGYLVEKKTSIAFADFLQQRFFDPLKMHSTNLQPKRARDRGLGGRIAMGHEWDKKAEKYIGFQTPDTPEDQGAGSIISSVNDYIKWIKAMMNCEHPITEELQKNLLRPRSIEEPEWDFPFFSPYLYGAGWETFYYRGYKMVVHGGGVSGMASIIFFIPAIKFGTVAIGNSNSAAYVINILGKEMIDELLKVPELERPDWAKVNLFDEEPEDEHKEEKLRQKLAPGITESESQKMPLSAYTGEYWNVGYQGMKVEIKDGKLFIDATTRSNGFYLTFDHITSQTKYIAHMADFLDGGDEPVEAEFRFDNDKVIKMGLDLEDELDGLIWFDKVPKENEEQAQNTWEIVTASET